MRVRLEDVCEKESSKLKQSDVIDQSGSYPVYGASGYLGNIDTYQQSNYYVAVVKDGAGIGRTMLLPPKSSIIGTMQYLIPKDNVLPEYLYYVVKAKHLEKYFSGATIPHIYFKDYKNEQFDLVSFEEQRDIINRIKKVEMIIDDLAKNLTLLDELVRARFVEMFGDLRVNDKGWKYYKLDELTELITDGEHATPKRTTQGIYLLSARNVLNHQLSLEDVDYIDYDEFSRISRRIIPREGDVLISCSGSIGRCCVVPKNIKFQMVRSIALLRFKSNINPVFAEYMITSDYLQDQINKSKTASSQANLFQGKIKSLKGVIPPLELQNQFASFVQEIDKSRSRIQKSLEASQELFDSLMQEYFG